MPNGCFVSDLHRYSQRSQPARYESEIVSAAASSDFMVLGGDLFDFRWSTLPSLEATVQAAAEWLEALLAAAPDCQFYYVLGNHDFYTPFVERLAELSQNEPRLDWYRYHLRLGDCLFVHGDVADGHTDQQQMAAARVKWQEERQRGRAANALYDAVVAMRLHKAASCLAYPHARTAERIAAYAGAVGHDAERGVRRVYFGHTHRAVADYEQNGLTFHNGGAPIAGLAFSLPPITMDVEHLQTIDGH